jgi:ribosomal protein S12 methylthiotransferase accessory factor YcaO
MKAVNFKIQNAIFKFNQKEVKEQIIQKRSAYASGETDKLLNLITTGDQETILIPEEPVFFDYTALDLIDIMFERKRSAPCDVG